MDDFFSPSSPTAANNNNQSTSDFLAREKELGLDTEFGTSSSNTFGDDKDYSAGASAFPDLDGDDGLGGFEAASAPVGAASSGARQNVSVTNDNEFAAFEDEYPEVEIPSEQPSTQHNGFNGDSSFGQQPPVQQQPQQQSSIFQSSTAPFEQESEFLKNHKQTQAAEIAKREEASQARKDETITKARNAIDNFYQEYNAKKEKNIAKNKEEESKFLAEQQEALAKGTTWDRICGLVDLQDSRSKTTTKSKQDLARFKEILLSLRREGDSAPGAAGY